MLSLPSHIDDAIMNSIKPLDPISEPGNDGIREAGLDPAIGVGGEATEMWFPPPYASTDFYLEPFAYPIDFLQQNNWTDTSMSF